MTHITKGAMETMTRHAERIVGAITIELGWGWRNPDLGPAPPLPPNRSTQPLYALHRTEKGLSLVLTPPGSSQDHKTYLAALLRLGEEATATLDRYGYGLSPTASPSTWWVKPKPMIRMRS